jgi:hypothetical protein
MLTGMERAEILQGQLRAAEALVDLLGARLPPVSWWVNEHPDLHGLVSSELSDQEHYRVLSHWADLLGTEVRTKSQVLPATMDGGSDGSSATATWVPERRWESLDVSGTHRGVRVGFSHSAAPGMIAPAHIPKVRRVPASDPVHRAQLQAATALVQVLNADLPWVIWGINGTRQEPELRGRLQWARDRKAPEELAEWAAFLATSVRYDRHKGTQGGYYRRGEVTGDVSGVTVTVEASARPPWSVTWRMLRNDLNSRIRLGLRR